jgi:hypothetical protein
MMLCNGIGLVSAQKAVDSLKKQRLFSAAQKILPQKFLTEDCRG